MVTARPEDTTMTPRTHCPDVPEPAMTRSRTLLAPLCAALALLATACSGGAERALATAKAKLATPATCVGTGAHDKHQQLGFSCTVCHPGDGGTYGFETYVYPGGTSTAGGVIVLSSAAGPTTCTVACHAPLGSPMHVITWDTPGPLDCTTCHAPAALPPAHPALGVPNPGTADCVRCHDRSNHTAGTVKLNGHPSTWMTSADPGFHALSANKGLGDCETCHGLALDGGIANVGCGKCHDAKLPDGTTLAWAKNCTMCHGDAATGVAAPPRATWGNGGDLVRVGAHAKHVAGTAISPAFACELCHVKPVDAFAAGHIDDATATVSFAGRAVKAAGPAPAWDRGSAACSNVACHGSASPVWTGGAEQAACGTCHGLPPASPHPQLASGALTGCLECHPGTMTAQGTVIPPSQGGLHLDGTAEATGGHSAGWLDQASTAFHAFDANKGLGTCQTCHGPDLALCSNCHDQNLPAGVSTWSKNCIMCHGGTANQTGAPPRTTWGNTADSMRVGAHTIHVTGSAMAGPTPCTSCHVAVESALTPGHIVDGVAQVVFGGVATTGNVLPSWNRTTGTCATTYCHGATIRLAEQVPGSNPRGTNVTPKWTAGASQATCGTCHGLPPDTGMHWAHVVNGMIGGNLPCGWCHAGYQDYPSPYTDHSVPTPALHVNGVKDVILSADAADSPANVGKRIDGWDSQSCHRAVGCHGLMD